MQHTTAALNLPLSLHYCTNPRSNKSVKSRVQTSTIKSNLFVFFEHLATSVLKVDPATSWSNTANVRLFIAWHRGKKNKATQVATQRMQRRQMPIKNTFPWLPPGRETCPRRSKGLSMCAAAAQKCSDAAARSHISAVWPIYASRASEPLLVTAGQMLLRRAKPWLQEVWRSSTAHAPVPLRRADDDSSPALVRWVTTMARRR